MKLWFARLSFFALATSIFFACNNDVQVEETRMVVLRVLSPKKDAQFIEGQDVEVSLDILEASSSAVLELKLNGEVVLTKKGVEKDEKVVLSTEKMRLGFNEIEIQLEGIDDKKHTDKRKIIVFANTQYDILIPQIHKTYPHNPKHYTQGYEFFGNRLFEGTGQFGHSMVAEINLNTGDAIRKVANESRIFGEGISILNDEIFQLTWQQRICYVYDFNDFSLKKEFTYDGEGWGLANDGENLYMSNGTSTIYVRNPKTFELLRTFEVFSNQREYRFLNELEYVDGFLYANVYQQDYILKIDPKDGRVLALIDCEELAKEGRGKGEVLNGIAYNKSNKRFYITGKYWDKVFEVSLQAKAEI